MQKTWERERKKERKKEGEQGRGRSWGAWGIGKMVSLAIRACADREKGGGLAQWEGSLRGDTHVFTTCTNNVSFEEEEEEEEDCHRKGSH